MTTTPRAPITGIRITTDKRVERVTLAGLADMQEAVGGLIEAVDLADGSTLYVNEEARIDGPRAEGRGPCADPACSCDPACGIASVSTSDGVRWYCSGGGHTCYERAVRRLADR